MRRYSWIPASIFILSLFFCHEAFALMVLKGDEASRYVGSLKDHLMSGKYTYEILARSHRDAMHGRFSDGTLFNPDGGKFLYPRRKNGDHIIVIDSPEGREESPVTEDAWREKLQNVLEDDNTIPYVFLDDARKELAILYVGVGTQVNAKMNGQGLLQVSLTVEGAKGTASTYRRRGPFSD